MANFDDARKRAKLLNPAGYALIEEVERVEKELSKNQPKREDTRIADVFVVGDVSGEEQEMAIFEGFLKAGCTPEEAAAEAEFYQRELKKAFPDG